MKDAPLAETTITTGKHLLRLYILLSLGYIIAQAATQVIGLLVVPIQASLHTSDTEMGFLQGFAFIFIYVVAGIPIAHWIDRGDRIRVIAVCVLLFSSAIIASGLARSFAELVVLRAFTAISEAGLPPAAFAIFSEGKGVKQTTRATAIFMLSPFIGAGVALAGGGEIAHLLGHWPLAASLGFTDPWRVVFLVLGLPGIVLSGLILLLCKDPGLPATGASRSGQALPLLSVLRLVFVEQPFFRSYHAALACFITFLFGYIAWFPTFLIRHYGLSLGNAGAAAGFTYMAGGVAGTLFSVAMAGRREKTGGVSATLKWFGTAMLLTVPLSILVPLVPDLRLTIALYAVVSFLAGSIASIMVVPLQLTLPAGVQGRAMAVFVFLTTAIGGTFGPLIIGLLSDRLGLSTGHALIVNGVVMSVLAAVLLRHAQRTLKAAAIA